MLTLRQSESYSAVLLLRMFKSASLKLSQVRSPGTNKHVFSHILLAFIYNLVDNVNSVATLESFKADLSSVSASLERMETRI